MDPVSTRDCLDLAAMPCKPSPAPPSDQKRGNRVGFEQAHQDTSYCLPLGLDMFSHWRETKRLPSGGNTNGVRKIIGSPGCQQGANQRSCNTHTYIRVIKIKISSAEEMEGGGEGGGEEENPPHKQVGRPKNNQILERVSVATRRYCQFYAKDSPLGLTPCASCPLACGKL